MNQFTFRNFGALWMRYIDGMANYVQEPDYEVAEGDDRSQEDLCKGEVDAELTQAGFSKDDIVALFKYEETQELPNSDTMSHFIAFYLRQLEDNGDIGDIGNTYDELCDILDDYFNTKFQRYVDQEYDLFIYKIFCWLDKI